VLWTPNLATNLFATTSQAAFFQVKMPPIKYSFGLSNISGSFRTKSQSFQDIRLTAGCF
jgi:hypothetical protein